MAEATNNLAIHPHKINSLVSYQEGSVVSREIIKTPKTTLTAFAFDKGQGLSEHTTPFTALVQIIDGEANIYINRKEYVVKEGELIVMPENIPHSLQAKKQFKMLLTMIK